MQSNRPQRSTNNSAPSLLLLVEDDPDDALLMQAWLARAGEDWEVIHSLSLADGLAVLDRVRPELIISDLGLPDAQGLTAAERFVQSAPQIPLLVLTGATRSELAAGALEAGAQDYISKDQISEDTLRRAMRFAITRHSAQRRLASLEGSLAEADNELEEYASMVAHDLRAPLRTSRLLAQTIQHRATDETSQDLANRLDATLGHLDSVVLSMLDYSGIRNAEPVIEMVDVHELLSDVVDALAVDLTNSEATINFGIAEDTIAAGTPAALWRVLENLLSNSIKFRSDERPLEIDLRSEVIGDNCRISVQDNGIGIPTTERERVMRPLERVDNRLDGSGFGLAICKRHVSSLGGRIWIDETDHESGGTTVNVELPIVIR